MAEQFSVSGPMIVAASVDGSDVAGIAALLIRFSDAVDQRRPADIAELFSPEGCFSPASRAFAAARPYWRFIRRGLRMSAAAPAIYGRIFSFAPSVRSRHGSRSCSQTMHSSRQSRKSLCRCESATSWAYVKAMTPVTGVSLNICINAFSQRACRLPAAQPKRPGAEVMSQLSLENAARIVDAALEHAQTLKLKPLTVAVLDAGGHLVAFKRQDRSGILRPDIAQGKAWGALGMGIGGRALAERAKEAPAFFVLWPAPPGGASSQLPAAF